MPCLSGGCAAPFFARVPICGRAIAAMLIARDDGLAAGCWAWGIGPVAGQGRTPVPCLSGGCAAPFFARVPTCGRAIAAMLTARDDGLVLGWARRIGFIWARRSGVWLEQMMRCGACARWTYPGVGRRAKVLACEDGTTPGC